jgi:hypothetical protein
MKDCAQKKDANNISFELKDQKLGYQNLKAVYYEGENSVATARVELVSNVNQNCLYHHCKHIQHDTHL